MQRIGLILGPNLKVVKVRPGGPCEGKDVREGDVLTKVDDIELKGMPQNDIEATCKGDLESDAILTFERSTQSFANPLPLLNLWLPDIPLNPFDEHKVFQVTVHRELKIDFKERVKVGLERRDSQIVQQVFNRFNDKNGLSKDSLLKALKQFDVVPDVSKDDEVKVEEIFKKYDTNGDGTIDLEEFKFAINDAMPIPPWIKSIPIEEMLFDCLPRKEGSNTIVSPQDWTDENVQESVEALKFGLTGFMQGLKSRWKEVNTEDLKKGPQLIYGRIEDFHKGLTARIGHPHLQFMSSMLAEHCKPDNQFEFETSNNHIKTTPKKEWELIHNPEKLEEFPKDSAEKAKNRKIEDLDNLMKLPATLTAGLIKAEVVSVVLYSGPMYFVYNSILRWKGSLYEICVEKNNLFSTSIHVLVSAVKKIANVTKLQPGLVLYRGLGLETGLPDCFFGVDEHGCSGFTELGFMSTTSSKEVAVNYSKANDGNPSAKVLELQCWSVDRGASIKIYSQYPEEVEYLYVPCSFVQPLGPMVCETTTKGNTVTMISVMVDCNLQGQTVEQLREEKRGLHVSAFGQIINDVETELLSLEKNLNAEQRLLEDKLCGNRTVKGFRRQIVEDCRVVLSKHKAVATRYYACSKSYRALVLEMLDVREMAVSKFREWLENKASSFLLYRFSCALRTAHRRCILYLEQNHETLRDKGKFQNEQERLKALQASALKLCRLANFVIEHAGETNELQETRIMVAAAEGRSVRGLRLLVEAGADVNGARPDGVTPMWLAAQFGHTECIRFLVDNGADVNAAAHDGATPVYIAAQSGHRGCIECLAGLKADLNRCDKNGKSPVDQARSNNHMECVSLLESLMADEPQKQAATTTEEAKVVALSSDESAPKSGSATQADTAPVQVKRLIISSGDIADVDGFMALAEYAKTGADVLFIINYPAYLSVPVTELKPKRETVQAELEDYGERDLGDVVDGDLEDLLFAQENPGLGFRYGADEVVWRLHGDDAENSRAYLSLMKDLGAIPSRTVQSSTEEHRKNDKTAMKAALTDVALAIVKGVWDESGTSRGALYFGIGGVNAINPFSRKVIMNEPLLYAQLLAGRVTKRVSEQQPRSGDVFDMQGERTDFKLDAYTDVLMDFCGSLAYWDEGWDQRVRHLQAKARLRGVFVMGGVRTDMEPVTLPSVFGKLNRLSSATMNQLYHPHASGRFFSFLAEYNVPTFVVSNNEVVDVRTLSAASFRRSSNQAAVGSLDAAFQFLRTNKIGGKFTEDLMQTFYGNQYRKPAQKPFDFYAARALTTFFEEMVNGGESTLGRSEPGHLFYSTTYGTTFVSRHQRWGQARHEYVSKVLGMMKSKIEKDPAEAIEGEKKAITLARRRELDVIRDMDHKASVEVKLLRFQMDPSTRLLTIVS